MSVRIWVKSSGPGPRIGLGVPEGANAYWRQALLLVGVRLAGELWPRDGVAVIIRRTL